MRPERRQQQGSHPEPLTLQTFVDHEASPAESLHLARHLSACPPCHRLRRRLEVLCDNLSSLPGAEVPEGFSRQVMRRVANMPPPRRHAPWLRLVVPAATAMGLALAALSNPWTVRLARGAGSWLPENPLGASEVMDLLVALGATILAGLARAAANLGPWLTGPTMESGTWFHLPASILVLLAGLAAGLSGIALAGSGLWFLRTRKISANGTTD